MAAFNPGGAEAPSAGRTESYLYWAAWAAHNATSVFGSQDAHGPYWRVFLSMTCADALELVQSPFAGVDPSPGDRGSARRGRHSTRRAWAADRPHGGVRVMQKQAPSIGRILVAAGFALSCFGLILFLWIAFGGPTPLKAKSYRVTRLLPGGNPARGRVRRADRRRLGRQGEGESAWPRPTSASRATTPPRP